MFHCGKDHHNLPKYSPPLKKTCVRQVALDEWFPLSARAVVGVDVAPRRDAPGKRDSIHHHLLETVSKTANVLELRQKLPYTTPSGWWWCIKSFFRAPRRVRRAVAVGRHIGVVSAAPLAVGHGHCDVNGGPGRPETYLYVDPGLCCSCAY